MKRLFFYIIIIGIAIAGYMTYVHNTKRDEKASEQTLTETVKENFETNNSDVKVTNIQTSDQSLVTALPEITSPTIHITSDTDTPTIGSQHDVITMYNDIKSIKETVEQILDKLQQKPKAPLYESFFS
jgi:FtsZ-interacting cell division protein ZipA